MLGSFEVRTDDGVLADVPGARLRALLIALALEPGHAVPKATLVDWIWGERPPSDAANALQRLASRLRKALPSGLIEGQPGGYRLAVAPDAVDALRFERLLAQARQEEGTARVRLLREALALWRGAAMHVALLRGELGRRDENRKTNVRAELTSFVGRDDDVAAVRELITEHRLTTLVGPGGSGKTRLATETARTLIGDLPDGVWLVELAAIGAVKGEGEGGGDVAQATVAGLGLRDALLGAAPSADVTDGLIAAIREREAALRLD